MLRPRIYRAPIELLGVAVSGAMPLYVGSSLPRPQSISQIHQPPLSGWAAL